MSAAQGCFGVAMGSSAMVPQRVEQSQLLVQHPDAPSPAQPQVWCIFTLELSSVNIIYTSDAFVFVREQSFTLLWHYAVNISVYSALLCSGVTRSAHRRSQEEDGWWRPWWEEAALPGAEPGSSFSLQTETQDMGRLSGEEGRRTHLHQRLAVG